MGMLPERFDRGFEERESNLMSRVFARMLGLCSLAGREAEPDGGESGKEVSRS
jgi:hypothetical protein